jgi:CheY-like chemotaxis protein
MNLRDATILLVDDEPDLREIFGYWLGDDCGRLYTAANGEEALAILKTTPIDLLVTDVRMPVMDGIALVRRLAALARPIPSIVFVSGFGIVDEREMYSLGVEAFLAKPLTREDFLEALEKTLAERSGLWLNPTVAASRQSIVINAECIGETAGANCVCLGRGGFSGSSPDAVGLGKVSFQCNFSSGRPAMSGQGFVRWYSKADHAVGIEFTFLDPPCRSWVLKEIATADPRSFIPGYRGASEDLVHQLAGHFGGP